MKLADYVNFDNTEFKITLQRKERPMKDSQKSKVYKAESRLRRAKIEGKVFNNIPEIDRWVNSTVLHSPWFKKQFPRGPSQLTVLGKRGSWAFGSTTKLQLPQWAWTKLTVLHELTHGTVWNNCINSWAIPHHGWQFTKTFLQLIQHFMGKAYADLLKMEYRELKVRYKKPYKRTVTPEQRVALRQRGLALAAKRKEIQNESRCKSKSLEV